MTMLTLMTQIRDLLWGGPLLFLLLTVGCYQTVKLQGFQFRYLGHALASIFQTKKKDAQGDISPFQALMTALAGAIGTGNITGIATAITSGGFGALFWMWIIAFLGMATAYAETLLAVKYRRLNQYGQMAGGPMYTLCYGLKAPKMAFLFSFFGALAALGLGSLVQANSVVDAVVSLYPFERLYVGCILAILVGTVVLGGIQSIGKAASILVPFMAVMYLGVGSYIICQHLDQLLPALQLIVQSAFTGQAAVGGFLGSSIVMAMRTGASNGVFANEAGLGSLAIAGASAQCHQPAEQGLYAISGVFVSTMIVCTITGLVLAVTGVLGTTVEGKLLTGSPLAMLAFGADYASFQYVVLIGLFFFAFTTILAWAYYGEKCVEYLMGDLWAQRYRWFYTSLVVVGAILELDLVWAIAHILNGLMALPNLMAIMALTPIVQEETKAYLRSLTVIKHEPIRT